MRNPLNETAADVHVRRCIVSGEDIARDDGIRLALGPDNVIAPDVMARAPGRGAWIGVAQDELAEAMARGKFRGALARAFQSGAVSAPEDLPERIRAALTRALTDRLGLEAKGGKLVFGFDRINDDARKGRVAMLLNVADASDDGCGKLDQALRVGSRDEDGEVLAETLQDAKIVQGVRLPVDRDTLSMALGRHNLVHLAVVDKGAARRINPIVRRLTRFLGHDRSGDPPPVPPG